jgi:hypothetical protein
MGIQQTTPQSAIDAQIQTFIDQQKAKVIKTFAYIGEKCITEARDNGAYQDRTGNLRASLGYVIVDNGIIVRESAQGSTAEGKAAAEDQLRKLAIQNTSGLVLIVVAGMDYAAKVEAMNLNVLSSAELLAEREVPRIMKKLGFAA